MAVKDKDLMRDVGGEGGEYQHNESKKHKKFEKPPRFDRRKPKLDRNDRDLDTRDPDLKREKVAMELLEIARKLVEG